MNPVPRDNEAMPFDPNAYCAEVAAILAIDGHGERLMPLVMTGCACENGRARLKSKKPRDLFPNSRAPEAAMSGLYVYFSCFEEAHEIAQNVSSAEGSYWHGIVHRQEPDAGNSGYWFRQTGQHPIFRPLRDAAAALGVDFGARWDPQAFIDLCEKARLSAGSVDEKRAREVQRVEWQLLFDYCARESHS
jgi:hypothetical protein